MKPLVLILIGIFLISGCSVWHPLRKSPETHLPPEYQGYYDYPKISLDSNLIYEERKGSYILKRYEFPLALPAELQVPNLEAFKAEMEQVALTDQKTYKDKKLLYTNRIDLYIPQSLKEGEKRPVILISPILGGNMVVDRFASYYAGRGYLAAIIYRKKPYWDEKQGIEQVENYLRASIIRLRQAVDWLEVQPQVDKDRMAAFGISYGAVLHAVLAAVEPRIKYHILAMPAGPLPEVIVKCPDAIIQKMMRNARESHGWTDAEIHEKLKATIKTDPMYLAAYIPKERVEVYIALFDRVVGSHRSFKLWRAMGKPKLKILPFGHYGGVLIFPYLQSVSYGAIKHHLN